LFLHIQLFYFLKPKIVFLIFSKFSYHFYGYLTASLSFAFYIPFPLSNVLYISNYWYVLVLAVSIKYTQVITWNYVNVTERGSARDLRILSVNSALWL
jgi:hypothetical protein